MKLFSIIIPFYSTRDYLIEALTSIKNQKEFDLNKLEVVIVNDGCNVDIENIISNFKKTIDIKYFKKKNGNWGSVINYIVNNKNAIGKYITVLDADDCFCLKAFNEFEKGTKNDPDMIISNFYRWRSISKKKRISKVYLKRGRSSYKITSKNKFSFLTPFSLPICKFYKKEIFYQLEKMNENTYFQDINLYFELFFKTKKLCYINKPLGKWRCDNNSSSTNEPWSMKKLIQWNNALLYLNSIGCTNIAIFYTLVKGYRKSYKKNFNQPLVFKKKQKNIYLPRILWPILKLFLFFCRLFSKKIFILK